ncbi:MAG: PadR family transcriptional regulator [Solirubrobacteraceae bacterium]|nr:PadR family transcriptional regulator [Patulibacter sp.]
MPPRFFRHGELPLVLLALLDETPRHGYEIMAELTRLFGPRYRPSPGSIYPAIEALEAEGLIRGKQTGDRVVYRPTTLGADALETRAEMLAALELRTGVHVGGPTSQSLDAMLTRFKARLAPLSGHVDPEAAAVILAQAALEIELLNPIHRPARKARKHHVR